MDVIDIPAASLTQFQRARSGKLIVIDDDVGNVAKDLQQIDPGLRLSYNPDEDTTIVWHEDGDQQNLVTTMQGAPDQRIVTRIREISRPGYNFADELEAVERQKDRERDYAFGEQIGDASERLAHAIRHDLSDQSRVFLNRGTHAR